MNIFVWKLPKIAAQKKVFFGLLRFLVFFNGLFDPTSWSRMSNIFRDSESLGKSNAKKWSNIWTFLFGSGLKLPRKKKFFLLLLILPWSTLLWHRCYYPHRSRDALSPVCGIFLIKTQLPPICHELFLKQKDSLVKQVNHSGNKELEINLRFLWLCAIPNCPVVPSAQPRIH